MAISLQSLRWPSLAHDLAVLAAPGSPLTDLSQVTTTYGISEQELVEILKVPLFQQYFKQSVQEMQAQGSKAGAMYRAATLAQGVSEKLYQDFVAGEMKAPDAIKFLDILLKASGLLDKQPAVAVQVNNTNTVAMPSPAGLDNPKFSHLVIDETPQVALA